MPSEKRRSAEWQPSSVFEKLRLIAYVSEPYNRIASIIDLKTRVLRFDRRFEWETRLRQLAAPHALARRMVKSFWESKMCDPRYWKS